MTTTATIEQLQAALKKVNKEYEGNIAFNRLDHKGKQVAFTLKAKSGLPGSRKAANGRNLPCASWHVHGKLFDAIFELNPAAIIRSSITGKITKDSGNWQEIHLGQGKTMSQLSYK